MAWAQLQSIMQANAEELRLEQDEPLTFCPLCSEVLQQNSEGILNCVYGHFRSE